MAGNFDATGTTVVSQTVITGGGTLDVSNATGGNTGGDIVVRQTANAQGAHYGILDISSLAVFNANVDEVLVGYTSANTGGANSTQRALGVLYLAQSNTITMNSTSNTATTLGLIVGYATGNASNVTSVVYLGQSNILNVKNVTIGGRKGAGAMVLNPALSSTGGSLTMRAIDGSSRVTLIAIGDNTNNTSSSTTAVGTMDLTGVNANIQATNIILGRTASGAVASTTTGATGTLTFNAGIIDVTGMTVALQAATSACPAIGTVNVSGTGNLQFGTGGLILAQFTGGTGSSTGTLNINGGIVQTLSGAAGANIMDGGGVSTINMTGGTIDIQGHYIGSVSAPIDNISLKNSTLDNIVQINAGVLSILDNVTLQVTLPGPLVYGSTFDILNWVSESGTFSTVNLPTLSDGLFWDSSKLYVDGTIQVVPEPATLLLLIMAAGLGLILRRIGDK